MLKIFFIGAMLSLAATGRAQQTEPFNARLLPRHTYIVTGTMDVDTEVPAKNNATGAVNKSAQKTTIDVLYLIKTGIADMDGKFSYTFTVTKYTTRVFANGVEVPGKGEFTNGGAYSGMCTADGKIQTESVDLVSADPKAQKTLIMFFNQLKDNELTFPDEPMKVGDSFIRDKPSFALTTSGRKPKQDIKVTYTLKEIKNNLAYFDTQEIAAGKVTAEKNGRQASTETKTIGTGTLVYDITQHWVTEKAGTADAQFTLSFTKRNVVLKMKNSYKTITSISAD